MEKKIWQESISVPYFLADLNGYLTIPSLMKYLIHVSSQQTANLNEELAEDLGLHWIIIQYQMDVKKLPKMGECMTVKTYAEAYNRYFCYRIFEVYDDQDEKMIEIVTVFALMDENRKLAKVPEKVVEGFGSAYERKIRRYDKPVLPESLEGSEIKSYHVRFFDIDENGHVNNANYFEWMLDSLPADFLKSHQITSGNVLFEREILPGEEVQSMFEMVTEEGQIHTRHLIQVGQEKRATGEFTWDKVEN